MQGPICGLNIEWIQGQISESQVGHVDQQGHMWIGCPFQQ